MRGHPLQITYSPKGDILYIRLVTRALGKPVSRELAPDVFGDFTKEGELVGLEILSATRFAPAEVLQRFGEPSARYTLAEAATWSGVKAASLRNQILNGRLRATKVGRDWMVDVNDLETYLADRRPSGRRSATEVPRRKRRRTAAA